MSIEAIDHLYIETPSFKMTCAFWEGLGFKLVDQWEDDDHLAGRLEAGNTYIVVAEAEKPSLTVHFRVSDIEKYAEHIAKNESITVQVPLEETHWGSRWMCVQAPDGQSIALEEPDKDA